jgi:UDP-glucose 4-epimerase
VDVRVLITGSSGFLGSHVAKTFAFNKHKICGLDRNPGKWTSHLVDLLDKEKTAKIIEELKPDIVYHFAANAAEGKSIFSPIDITERNIGIFMNTIVPCIRSGMRRFIFSSSVAVYGDLALPFRESDPPIPQDIYGVNKMAIEQSLRILGKVHDFEYVIARLHNVYGPHQNMKDPYRNVVTIFMNNLLKEKAYYIYGDGSMRRCFSYIDDVNEVLYKCGVDDVHGLVVNIGSDKSYSIKELSDTIQEVSGVKIPPMYIPDRPQEVHIAKSDHTIALRVFGYKDTPFKEGIKKTWEWCKKQGPQELKKSPVEIDSHKIPKNWKNET